MKLLTKLMALMFVTLLTLSLCACGGNATDPQNDDTAATTTTEAVTTTTAPQTTAFEVKVVDQNGNPVADVMLQICKDTCIPSKTDANGVATFNVEVTDEHKLSVLSCPTGYTYTGEAEVYLENGITEYTVELQGE